jgi:hypothetical protein
MIDCGQIVIFFFQTALQEIFVAQVFLYGAILSSRAPVAGCTHQPGEP